MTKNATHADAWCGTRSKADFVPFHALWLLRRVEVPVTTINCLLANKLKATLPNDYENMHCEAVQRVTADFICFHALWSPLQRRNLCNNSHQSWIKKAAARVELLLFSYFAALKTFRRLRPLLCSALVRHGW